MSALAPSQFAAASMFPHRYRSLKTLLAMIVIGSLAASTWLMPSRLERLAVALDHGDQPLIDQELELAMNQPADPGEARALVDVALTLGAPDKAAAILERFLAAQPSSVEGLRLLLEVQRQRHLIREAATLDERIFALTGDPDALRESADIYASQRMIPERIDALRRLASIDRATASDIAELTHRLVDTGDREAALAILMRWLLTTRPNALPAELLGLAAGLSAGTPEATAVAAQLGALVGRVGQVGFLHVLVQIYGERGHPELSLAAGQALGEAMGSEPEVVLTLAQLDALQGNFAAAERRLGALEYAGTLPSAARSLLAQLRLQTGDLPSAVALAASLSPDQLQAGFPRVLVQALDAAGRTDLLARLPPELMAASPASAASVLLARGDRAHASDAALQALNPAADVSDLGPPLARVVHSLGLEHTAIVRLLPLVRDRALNESALWFLEDLVAMSRADIPALLDPLWVQRERNPRAGAVWAVLAARNGRAAQVTDWLRTTGPNLPAQDMIDLLLASVEHGETALASAAAATLIGRTDLPPGWTAGEIALTANARSPITPTRLRDGLDLITKESLDSAARDRLIAILVGAPGFAQVATSIDVPETHPAVAWLAGTIAAGGTSAQVADKLTLLAAVAPKQALPLLAPRLSIDRRHLLPIYVASLLRTGRATDAVVEVRRSMSDLPPQQQDSLLHEILARLPQSAAMPVLRFASTTGRPDWRSAYQDALARAGLQDELRKVLRAEAEAERDPKRIQALASRLVELNDRADAIAVIKPLAAGRDPASGEVENLMFLWGPRATPEAVHWTREQALLASAAALPKWLEHLAYLGDPAAVIAVVERRPAALSSASAVRSYDAALITMHERPTLDLRAPIVAASSPDLLIALAQLAIDTAQPANAWQAARAAVTAAPNNPDALRLAAQAAAAMHRSQDASDLYARLLARGPQSMEVCIDAADALIAGKRVAEGRRLLQAALAQTPNIPPTMSSARLRARALMLLGRYDEASGVLKPWLDRFPADAGLKADMLQAHLNPQSSAH